jgi:hypothetical protein
MGITSSKIIAQNLGGDLIIMPTRHRDERFSTEIEITIPVEI